LWFVGLMLMGVAVVGVLASLRHGLNGLAGMVGVLGLAMFVTARIMRRDAEP
jgi:hypothetical protein